MEKEIARKVLKYIDEQRDEIISFLSDIISFNTSNPPGLELEAQRWLAEKLDEFGFDKVDYWAVDKNEKRPNTVGVKNGLGGGRSLIFNGHIDVSAVSEEDAKKWTYNPWKATSKDGKLYGRGSTDMKGGLAACIWAAKTMIDSGINLKGDLIIESVVGEEWCEQHLGTLAVCERGYKADLAIVPEPTNCEIHSSTSGFLVFEIYVPGKPIHVATKNLTVYPQRTGMPSGSQVGVNAILKTMKIIQALEELERQWVLRPRKGYWGSGGVPHPDTQGIGLFTTSISAIEGGDFNKWSIADHCRIRGCTYYPPWLTAEEVKQEMLKAIEGVATTDDWIREMLEKNELRFEIVPPEWPPCNTAPDNEGGKVLFDTWKEATGMETTTSGARWVSDASFLYMKGIPSIVMGPGDISMGCHGIDEYVPIDQLINCTKAFALAIMKWCKLTE